MMENRNERPAAASGAFAIGGDLHVSRLGFGAMRITGDGVWGPPKEKDAAIAVLKRWKSRRKWAKSLVCVTGKRIAHETHDS